MPEFCRSDRDEQRAGGRTVSTLQKHHEFGTLFCMTGLYIAGAVIIVIVLLIIWGYNRFVTLTNRAEEAWSDIDVQLKRRYDLIPNLVETVKGYAAHEAGTLQKVTEARTKAMGAQTIQEHADAENMLTGALKSLFAVSEAYPDLKANSNFVELQRELSDTENKIQAARRFYNSVVQDLQNAIESFPSNLIANMFSFQTREFFALNDNEQAAREPVKVSF
jgi:LemA protein